MHGCSGGGGGVGLGGTWGGEGGAGGGHGGAGGEGGSAGDGGGADGGEQKKPALAVHLLPDGGSSHSLIVRVLSAVVKYAEQPPTFATLIS